MSDDTLHPPIVIRRLGESDGDEVRRLAQLDSSRVPEGELLGAKIDGRLVAAISLAGGDVIADPFAETQGIQRILELRMRQLKPLRRYRRPLGGFAGRASLGGSW